MIHRSLLGRVLLFVAVISLASGYCFAQDTRVPIDRDIKKETFTYAKKDTSVLQLDVYTHPSIPKNSPCIIFVFGGGFFTGKRDEEYYNKYFNSLVHEKYVVVSISYRLGIHGMQKLFASKFKPLRSAIDTAVVDLYDATNWVIKNRKTIGIDTTKIILSGSSAGAIVVLQSDFEKRNKTKLSKRLSTDFQYAGVISFSGAILSYHGPLRYRQRPAPTLMFHGTHDKMVIYRQVAFFNRSLSGSYSIAKTFRKFRYPYYFYKVRGMGHEIAAYPMHDNFKQIAWFINELVLKKKRYQVEESFNNLDKKRGLILSAEDIYKDDKKK